MKKNWYNFFVVTEGQGADPSAGSMPPEAPRRVTEVVPGAEADTNFSASVANPSELDDIYRSAQIAAPPHGYTVLKVAEMLQSEHIRALPADVKRKSIMVALDAAGVKVKDIITDAVQRDRALDTFENVLEKHLSDLRARKDVENTRLEKEINQKVAELRAQIDENNKEVSREKDDLLAWRTKKRQEEERIAEAVSYFVSENPITTTEKGGADHVR